MFVGLAPYSTASVIALPLVEAVRASARELRIPAERLHDEAFSFHSSDTYAFERAERSTP